MKSSQTPLSVPDTPTWESGELEIVALRASCEAEQGPDHHKAPDVAAWGVVRRSVGTGTGDTSHHRDWRLFSRSTAGDRPFGAS